MIVALDFAESGQAMALVERIDPKNCALKVGKEMFVIAGPEPVRRMIERGFRVFLDLKFHDIPNTVAQACAAATRLGVWMLNVHAAGGRAMLVGGPRRQSSARAHCAGRREPLLIGVTVLTSLDAGDLEEVGFAETPEDGCLRLALLAAECGLDGVVCSAVEAPVLRQALGASFKLVTPGIRPGRSASRRSGARRHAGSSDRSRRGLSRDRAADYTG